MPKAQTSPFEGEEEEEKTTIESGWEEEPSTTVEQGEVAERIRALVEPRRGGTNVTSTNGHMLDEPTVDDQRANAALSLITPVLQARLVVTAGNDSGQDLMIAPGKTYTIGRSIDNDIVLTDIAVSRKHFDLRHENGSWVLVDRGSGNGTLVNGNLEDHPFLLATGDAIEIGNTTFRFEQPNGMPRPQQTIELPIDSGMDPIDRSMDSRLDSIDEEEEPSTVAGKPVRADEIVTPAQISSPRQVRASTMPPPAPLRARTPSAAPPAPYVPPLPATTLPMPQMPQGRPMGAQAPTMLGDSMGIPLPGQLPPTRPGQGAPPAGPQVMFHNNGYPPVQNLSPQAHNAQMLVINGLPGRDAPSTALVPPTPYNGMPVAQMPPPPPTYVAPQISRRTKLILGGAGLTLFAAIATVAIIKGGAKKQPAPTAAPVAEKSKLTKPGKTISPIETPDPKPTKVTEPPKKDPAKTNSLNAAITGEPPKTEPVKTPPVVPTKTVAPIVEPPKKDPPKTDPPKIATVTTPAPIVEPPKKDPPKADPPKVVKADPPKKKEREPKKVREPRKEPAPKRVATADASDAKNVAAGLFRDKQFALAADTLRKAASKVDDADAKELKSLAEVYRQFGKMYNGGSAPTTPAKEAWEKLSRARSFDPDKAFADDINAKLGAIAPKAAVAFMASKDYVSARQAVLSAERAGTSNSTVKGVKDSLEMKAGELFKQAKAEASTDPAAAKQKYRQIQNMVDSKSQWHQRAGKELSAG